MKPEKTLWRIFQEVETPRGCETNETEDSAPQCAQVTTGFSGSISEHILFWLHRLCRLLRTPIVNFKNANSISKPISKVMVDLKVRISHCGSLANITQMQCWNFSPFSMCLQQDWVLISYWGRRGIVEKMETLAQTDGLKPCLLNLFGLQFPYL